MNLEQVRLRREAIGRRLDELQQTHKEAQYNSRWYLSTDRVQELQQLAADLPQNLGSRSLAPHPVRIAMLSDEFLYDSLRDSARVTYLRQDNFREVAQDSELLIVASTWRGDHDE